MVGAVPHAGRGDRLLGVDLPGEGHVEAPEVDQLAGRVDLGLDRGLGLAEHGGGVQGGAPRAGQQVGGLEQHGRPVVEGHRPPLRRGRLGGVDGGPGVLVGRPAHACPARGAGCAAGRPRSRPRQPNRCSPPIAMVSSRGSLAIRLSVLSSSARSALPGAYCRTGSLTGAGTWVTASMLAMVPRSAAWWPHGLRRGRRAGRPSSCSGVPAELVVLDAVDQERASSSPASAAGSAAAARRTSAAAAPSSTRADSTTSPRATGPASRTAARSTSGAGPRRGVGQLGRQHDAARSRRRPPASSRNEARAAAVEAAYSSSSRSPSTYHSRSAGVTA